MRKIIVKLEGGLGNQIFQYGFGLALSIKNKCELYLDIDEFKSDKLREYSLGEYNISAKVCTGFIDKIRHVCDRIPCLNNYNIWYKEKEKKVFEFQKVEGESRYFEGYWQHLDYLKKVDGILRNQIKIDNLSSENEILRQKIHQENALAVHVRRGDYLGLDIYERLTENDYYEKALKYIWDKELIDGIYIFSDDAEWCRSNILDRFKKSVNEQSLKIMVIENKGRNGQYIDLELMKECKHHIIANSTYSFWGAYLSRREGINIAPDTWFTEYDINERIKNAILKGFVLI